MIETKVIIVGGGPAGSSCAWRLSRHGITPLLLDKKTFPRNKLCAGWITPKVFQLLGTTPGDYPHTKVLHRVYHFHYKAIRLPVPTRQYVIRRHEFDNWSLERSGAQVENHKVTSVRKEGSHYVIDDKFRCEYLVGAGGTNCPIYNSLFKPVSPRKNEHHLTTLEEEFQTDYKDSRALFWYLDNQLSGYSWYTPKADNVLTIGIGGHLSKLKANNQNIREHWNLFLKKLRQKNLIPEKDFKPKGWTYYVRDNQQTYQLDSAFIIGDAAGMATVDMGEGIRPAIESGILVANAIASNTPYNADRIGKYSIRDILFPGKSQ